ncbi:MAG: hypothetical protein ABR568_04030 [Pyrinomonadaceae bacterium]
MAIWFQIAIVLNIICWAVFVYLLLRRRWNVAALLVGVFHMMFAGVVSVAPIRSLLDADYIGYGIGVIQLEKRMVALPAALILGWALTAAWIAIGKGRGRWMRLVMVGDLLFALSMGLSTFLDDPENWKFQMGEYLNVTGVPGLLILLGFFTLPFIASAIWAANRTQANGTAPPLASNTQDEHGSSEKDGRSTDGFRYSEGHV